MVGGLAGGGEGGGTVAGVQVSQHRQLAEPLTARHSSRNVNTPAHP